MAVDSDWISAGTEPRLAEILSDPATRSLMAADGVKDDDVNALIDRIRCSVSPMQFVPEKKAASGMTAKVARPAPTRSNDHKLSMLAASGVVSRWIASISGERITAD